MRSTMMFAGIAGAGAATAMAGRRMMRGGRNNREPQSELRHHVSDMLALDRHILSAVERQLMDTDAASYANVRELLESTRDMMGIQISRLERELELLGGDLSTPIKSAVSSAAGSALGLLDRVRHAHVSRMIRDNYTALSLASVSYSMLHTTALALKSHRTAEMAQQCLMDITPLIVRYSEQIPVIVVNEMARDSLPVDVTVSQEAVDNTQRAWAQTGQSG
jgi:hypothetical protein